jgi:hypothetical protein
MSDQALEQSQDVSIEARMASLLSPEQEEEEQAEAAPQDNEVETEESEAVETQEEENPDEQVEAEEETAEPDLVEVEVDGQSYKVPEVLKDKIMLQADYTRKTQEVAEQRKQLELGQAQLQQAAQLQQQSLAEYAQLVALDNQLNSYNQVDWNALYDSDPAEFVRLKESRRDLIDQRAQIAHQVTVQQQQQAAKQQETLIQVIEEGKKVLAREIPSWNTELANSINKFAIDKFGFTPEEVNAVIDPRVVKVLHKAYLYEKQLSNKPLTDKRVANLPKVSKPGGASKQTVSQSKENDARKILKKTGSTDAAQAVFLARYSK